MTKTDFDKALEKQMINLRTYLASRKPVEPTPIDTRPICEVVDLAAYRAKRRAS